MLNKLTIGERPNKKNIESLDLAQKVNLLKLWRGKKHIYVDTLERAYLKYDDPNKLFMWL